MAGKKFLRVQRGERIDYPDFEHAVEVSQRDIQAQIVNKFLVGDDVDGSHPRAYVLKGFAVSVDAGGIVTVNGGNAILAIRDRGEIVYGMLVSEGDDAQTFDISAFANGTYNVYVRAEFDEVEFKNRPFWNPLATPDPAETTRNIPTRLVENWVTAIEVASPGDEWMRIATVTKATGPVFTSADKRNFFFEGQADNLYKIDDAEWGDTNDRSVARETYGTFGLYRALRGLQRQVQDIIGKPTPFTHGWWSDPTAGGARSLVQLVTEKLARDGSQTMAGNLKPDGSGTRLLGDFGAEWSAAYVINLISNGGYLSPLLNGTGSLGTASFYWATAYINALLSGTITPKTHETYNLGSAVARWLQAHIKQLIVNEYAQVDGVAPGTMPPEPRIFANTMVHAWGHIEIVSGVITSSTRVGCEVTIPGSTLKVTLHNTMFNADNYVVLVNRGSNGAPNGSYCDVGNKINTEFYIGMWSSGGALIDLSVGSGDIDFVVIGRKL